MTEGIERDPATLSSAEALDEDRLQLDPLEEGMDPPEHWSAANRYGTTQYEESHGQDLDHRLDEEEPDVQPETEFGESSQRLDDSIDERNEPEVLGLDDRPDGEPNEAVRTGRSADEAGGSIAREIRTPPQRPV
jgi:hypothetical protein